MSTAGSTWADLLAIARFAPSPHNTQPWRVHVLDGNRAELLIVKARTLPDEDTTGSFIRLAMGIFIEALSIAAANAGMRLLAEVYAPERTGDGETIPFASLALVADPTVDRTFANQSILDRRTSRLPTDGRIVPMDVVDNLTAVAAAGSQRFLQTSDSSRIRRILDRNVQAVAVDLNSPAYHDEIVTWFRYSESQAAATRDGLDARCMNTPALELKMIAAAPGLMRAPVTGPLLRAWYLRRHGATTQIGMLAGEFFEHDAAVPAGRCLMRLWLSMHDHGVTIHPFGNLVTNPEAAAWMRREMGVDKIWLVFRMGYTPLAPRSKRLSVEQILC